MPTPAPTGDDATVPHAPWPDDRAPDAAARDATANHAPRHAGRLPDDAAGSAFPDTPPPAAAMPDSPPPGAHDDAPIAAAKHAAPEDIVAALDIAPQGDSVSACAVTINRPVGEVYAFWRDVANLPRFMENVVAVTALDDRRSHWVVKAPAGRTIAWDAVITDDEPDRLLAWQSAPGADIAHSGRVEFIDSGARGTVVVATILYDPPGGTVGKLVAKLFQREPAIQARRDLRRFKQLLETGEIATAARTRAEYDNAAERDHPEGMATDHDHPAHPRADIAKETT